MFNAKQTTNNIQGIAKADNLLIGYCSPLADDIVHFFFQASFYCYLVVLKINIRPDRGILF